MAIAEEIRHITIAEEIRRKTLAISKKEVKDFIREAIIKTFKDYPDRVVGFGVFSHNISKPFIVAKADSPFPQFIFSIYIPEILPLIELNEWLNEEGFKWDVLDGEYAWRLA